MVFEYNKATQGGGSSVEMPLMKITGYSGSNYGISIVVIKTDKKFSEITFTSNTQMTVAASNNSYVWNNGVLINLWATNGTAPTGVVGEKGVVLTMNPNVPVDISDYDYVGFQYRKDASAAMLMSMFELKPKEGYKPPERKYILKDGAFVGQPDVDYKTRGTIGYGDGYVTHSGYQNGIGVYADFTKYKRLVFVSSPVSGNDLTQRMYKGTTPSTLVFNNCFIVANNNSSDWYWSTPNPAAKTYDIYLEPNDGASVQALSLDDEEE